ncbi:type II secretion system secretin GspD [Maricaulis parjimensis]|uniref:type II secretion system secretin GspD n=1 Tax=Maricaulis parjimensis TaxID=144023 RepID=UPI0019396DB3|nr:type II secretion system secretin GspD [Maricaulis parjimensis]
MVFRSFMLSVSVMAASLALSGCETLVPDASRIHADRYPQAEADRAGAAATSSSAQSQTADTSETANSQAQVDEGGADRLVYFEQSNGPRLAATAGRSADPNRTLRLNFVDAPVVEAVRTIVEEALGETVMVSDGVGGRITLTSQEPAAVPVALSALEAVLAESGLALIERETGYLLTRADTAQPNLPTQSGQLGYGGRIVPVVNTDPSSILLLIDPFLTDQLEAIPLDEAGVIVLAGPGSEVQSAESAIRTFDRPFLTNRVFGMFELRYVNAQTAKTEVDAVLEGLGVSRNAARTIALPRLNLLFVTTRDRGHFNQVQDFIERFDRPSGGDTRRLRYYVARNAPAATLASQISAAFAGSAAGSQNGAEPRFAGDDQAPGAGDSEEEGRLAIIPDLLNNALIIRATDQEYREIIELVERMDVMPPQVLIEATIAEVRLVDGLDFGVRWFFESQSGEGDSVTSFIDNESGTNTPVYPGFNYAFTGTNFQATLSALNSITDVTVLSAPSIMVQNNQTAHLQVGDEVPIVTQTATSVAENNAPLVSSIELRETGVILEVTPRINASGLVVLDVNQEVSTVRPTTTSGIDSPTIQKLEFTSTVAVRSANTIALGGLIRETRSDNEAAIPLISRVPGLGNAFRNRQMSSERSELVIFLTPRIINNDDDAAAALQHLRRELEALEARQQDLFD